MNDSMKKINYKEASFYYTSEHALVDYSQMQSFSLIKSCVEVLAAYGVTDFSAEDVRDFFAQLHIIQQKNQREFLPSPKKVDSVLECCLGSGRNRLSKAEGRYHIESWDSDGYRSEISFAYERGWLSEKTDAAI